MNTTYYQATEGVLYSYSKVKSYIEDLEVKLDEVEKSEWSNVKAIQYDKISARVYGITSATENSVMAKFNFMEEIKKEISKNKDFIDNVDKVFKNLNTDEKQLIRLLYFRGVEKEKAMKILKVKKDKFYGLKNNAVKDFSVGWFGIKALNDAE